MEFEKRDDGIGDDCMIRKEILEQTMEMMDTFISEEIELLDVLKVDTLNIDKTAIVVLDMIRGFAKHGALYSPRVERLIKTVVADVDALEEAWKVFLCDSHDEEATQFSNYPPHCVKGTEEAEIVPELKPFIDSKSMVIEKNSTNGFLEPAFQEWLEGHMDIDNWIVEGDCTDICVLQFTLTLKAHFDRIQKSKRIIVPVDAVDTFHLEETNHLGDAIHIMALKLMKDSGIELVKGLE